MQHYRGRGPQRPSGSGHQSGSAGRPSGPGQQQRAGQARSEIADILQRPTKIEFWTTENGKRTLRPALLDKEAQAQAKRLELVPPSQLRRFYAPVMAFLQRLRLDRDEDISGAEVRAQAAYLKASAAYAGARKPENEVAEFYELVEFFVRATNSIEARDDFVAFARHFEAVVAFHKVHGKEKRERN